MFGRHYWAGLIRWLQSRVLSEAKISPGDLDLILLTDDPAGSRARRDRRRGNRSSRTDGLDDQSDGERRRRNDADRSRDRGGFKASRHGDGKRASAAGPKGEQKRAAEERERAGAAAHVAREEQVPSRRPHRSAADQRHARRPPT